FGQAALTMSRSSAISSAQPVFPRGYLVPPFWSTFLKQPLAVVHGGRPNWARYTARSLSALGLSYASTMATVMPEPAAVLRLYAAWRSAGPKPEGVALVVGLPSGSIFTQLWQRTESRASTPQGAPFRPSLERKDTAGPAMSASLLGSTASGPQANSARGTARSGADFIMTTSEFRIGKKPPARG